MTTQATSYGNIEVRGATELAASNYTEYAKYVLETRALPSIIDGLKFVQRRALYVAAKKPEKLVKLPNISGDVMKLHPHSSDSIDGTLISLGTPSNSRLFKGKGNFGGYNFGAAASRYLEAYMEPYARYGFTQFDKYAKYVQGEVDSLEPYALPALIPYSLMDGASGMGVGLSTDIMPLNLMDTVDYFIDIINHKEQPRIPRPDLGRVIIDLSDEEWKEAVKGIRGHIRTKSIITQESNNTLVINDLYKRNVNQILKKIQTYLDDEIIDFRDESTDKMRLVFELVDDKKLSMNSLRTLLEKATTANTTFRHLVVDGTVAVYCDLQYQATRTLSYLNETLDKKFDSEIKELNFNIEVYKVIDFLIDSGYVDRISSMSYDELVTLISTNSKFSSDAIKAALEKSIKFLTNSHKKELEKAQNQVKEIKSYDRTKYLTNLYETYKKLLKPLYDAGKHSIMRSQLLENPRVKFLKGAQEIVVGRTGMDFKEKVFKIYDKGYVETTVVSSEVKTRIKAGTDEHGTPVALSTDCCKYTLIITNKDRVLGIDSSKWYDKQVLRLDDDEVVRKAYPVNTSLEYKGTKIKNPKNYVKSRVAIPIKL